jgi:hypothetical protein
MQHLARPPATAEPPPPAFVRCVQLEEAVGTLLDVDMPMKRLLLLFDLARQGLPEGQLAVPVGRWAKVIQDLAIS